MRYFLFLLLCSLCSIVLHAETNSYADKSVLSSGNVVKIRVSENGIHSIPYDTLKAWGLQPDAVRIMGYGGGMLSENFTLNKWDDLPSVAFYMYKGADGVFNSGDYILFYAQGAVKWEYVNNKWHHTTNTYSKYGYYFVSDNTGEQRIIQEAAAVSTQDLLDVDWYTYYQVHEKDMINLIDVQRGESGGGREFYGEELNQIKNNLILEFPTANVRTDLTSYCLTDLAIQHYATTRVQVQFGNANSNCQGIAIQTSDFYTKAEPAQSVINTSLSTTGKQSVTLTYIDPPTGATAYLNYVEVNIPCQLQMTGNSMAISNCSMLKQSQGIRFTLSNAKSSIQVWKVTDGVNIEKMPSTIQGDQLTWIGNNTIAEKYVALDPTATGWLKPTKVGKVTNQNLHALRNINYVIICPKEFVEPATRLAKKHEEKNQLTWAVVTDEQVYNEFSSGTPDASAYRWLMKMLYDRDKDQQGALPKSLLLLGHGTYDNRKISYRSGEAKLLTFQAKNSTKETLAYTTDDYFGFMQSDAGVDKSGNFSEVRATMDIGVGRLPAKNIEEANNMVNKLCRYLDNKNLGKWKTQLLFLADDGDQATHIKCADNGAEKLRTKNKDFIVNKIYLDAHHQETNAAGESYPLAKNQFDNLMNNGVMHMNYSGHGGYNNITNELFMKSADIRAMSNANQGFWFLATCSFSHCDGGVTSAGEEAILNPNGGAIGVLSACRTVYATQNEKLNINLCDTLLGHKSVFNYHMTLGEAIRIAKNVTGRDMNKLPYVFLGDPALRLNYPTNYQIKTSTKVDTLNALSTQTIEGYIQTSDLDTAYWFNGKLEVTIYDKIKQITTLDNDQTEESKKVKLNYLDYPNMLFAGQTDVVNGKFTFTFVVPKDIRYNFGNGRITYYAYDEESKEEAVGHFEDFIIGGSSTLLQPDSTGPILNIYLNNAAFKSGDKTYEYPHFYAEIEDENGINTVGSGIGHDLLLTIDNDPKKTYILNNYFSASNNSYQRGVVSYKMQEQEEGPHTLSFRAWDLYNNSNTVSLNYNVIKGLAPQIYNILTYPNPVSKNGILTMEIALDQPNESIETTINLYNTGGQLVYTYSEMGAKKIVWNMNNIGLSEGVYVYQVSIKTTKSKYISRAGKLIVTK